MKKIIVAVGAVLIAITWFAVARQASAKPNDEAAIEELEDHLAKAVNAKDVDGVMACYVPDASLFVFDIIPPRQYVGAKAYRDNWNGFFQAPVTFKVTDLSVESDGKLAFGHMIHRVVATDAKGNKFEVMARVTDVYRKISGKWLIVHEHISVPVDLGTGKADLMSKP